MTPTTSRTLLFVLLIFLLTAAIAGAQTPTSYKHGTISKSDPSAHKSYDLKGDEATYHIKGCGDFQAGQAVDYRVDEFTIYIRREGGKDYRCTVESVDSGVTSGVDTPQPPKYQQGTILGYDVRRDTSVHGGGGNGIPVGTSTRMAKVYQLKAANLLYKVDYCGAFQAGQFQVGQVVEFRVDSDRLYIRHDGEKEFNCKLEGVSAAEGAKPEGAAPADTSASH
jgi:hypothetical protein